MRRLGQRLADRLFRPHGPVPASSSHDVEPKCVTGEVSPQLAGRVIKALERAARTDRLPCFFGYSGTVRIAHELCQVRYDPHTPGAAIELLDEDDAPVASFPVTDDVDQVDRAVALAITNLLDLATYPTAVTP